MWIFVENKNTYIHFMNIKRKTHDFKNTLTKRSPFSLEYERNRNIISLIERPDCQEITLLY